MVQSQQMQDGGMEIVDGDDLVDRFVSELIGGPVAESLLHPSPSQPAGKSIGIMIPSLGPFLEGGHASKFSAPHHEGLFQKTPLLEVDQESCSGFVQNWAVHAVLTEDVLVTIPVAHPLAAGLVGAIEQLDKPHTLLHQPTRQDAVLGVGSAEFVDL